MGEMIKFGIKLAMTIACAVALVAAIALLFTQIPTLSSANNLLVDVFALILIILPIDFATIFALLSPLFAFKIAYWAADKMIQFIDAAG